LTAVRDPLAPTGRPWVRPAAKAGPAHRHELLADADVLVVAAGERASGEDLVGEQTRNRPTVAGARDTRSDSDGEGSDTWGEARRDRAHHGDVEREHRLGDDRADDDQQRRGSFGAR
jgi:hypothetical protein